MTGSTVDLKYGLSAQTLNCITDVFRKYPQIEQVLIYGSRAKGNFKPGSDIDLSLKGQDISMEILLQIDNELDDLLLPYKFDLSIYNKITDHSVLEHIDRVGIIFFQQKV